MIFCRTWKGSLLFCGDWGRYQKDVHPYFTLTWGFISSLFLVHFWFEFISLHPQLDLNRKHIQSKCLHSSMTRLIWLIWGLSAYLQKGRPRQKPFRSLLPIWWVSMTLDNIISGPEKQPHPLQTLVSFPQYKGVAFIWYGPYEYVWLKRPYSLVEIWIPARPKIFPPFFKERMPKKPENHQNWNLAQTCLTVVNS